MQELRVQFLFSWRANISPCTPVPKLAATTSSNATIARGWKYSDVTAQCPPPHGNKLYDVNKSRKEGGDPLLESIIPGAEDSCEPPLCPLVQRV